MGGNQILIIRVYVIRSFYLMLLVFLWQMAKEINDVTFLTYLPLIKHR